MSEEQKQWSYQTSGAYPRTPGRVVSAMRQGVARLDTASSTPYWGCEVCARCPTVKYQINSVLNFVIWVALSKGPSEGVDGSNELIVDETIMSINANFNGVLTKGLCVGLPVPLLAAASRWATIVSGRIYTRRKTWEQDSKKKHGDSFFSVGRHRVDIRCSKARDREDVRDTALSAMTVLWHPRSNQRFPGFLIRLQNRQHCQHILFIQNIIHVSSTRR